MKSLASKMSAILACFMILMFAGCVKNEFKIDFEFPKDHIGNYVATYYAWDKKKGMWIEQTASVQEGVASLGFITRLPTLVYISDASSPSNSIVVYANRGDKLKITGEGKDMWTWSVKGNKLSERWSEWRNGAASVKSDRKALEKSISDYVEKNPSDELSALLMITEWDRRENPEGFLKLWNAIDKDVRTQDLNEMAGSSDLFGVQFTVKADGSLSLSNDPKLKSVVFRSLDNGVDTLRFNKVNASILYFFTENNSDRKEALDTLKSLSKAYPDSLKRIICDISVDTDSMAWRGSIRRDSLKGAVRAWLPYGLSDENMVKLGVYRIPWIIVKDKSGAVKYAGTDLKEAASEFRKEMGKKK